jgi:hypothetical protein
MLTEREPETFSTEAERAVLGAILLNPDALARVRGLLAPEDFYVTAHQIVFRAMLALADDGRSLDNIELTEWLRAQGTLEQVGGSAAVAELLNEVASADNIVGHARIVQEYAQRRKLARRVWEALELVAQSAPLDQITECLRAAIPELPAAPEPAAPEWPAVDEAAYTGLAGEFVKAIEPYSEADPVALLLHTLVAFGCLVGRGPHVLVEHVPHHARLFVCFVGRTASARKGTAWSTPRFVFSRLDPDWARTRIMAGLSSGEGLVFGVRDADGDDLGEPDKRMLVIEQEFGGALKAMQREGNTLAARLREAWDHGMLTPLTKRDRLRATDAHICIVGHITEAELLHLLSDTDRLNGFANRFLFALVKRSKFLPAGNGAPLPVIDLYCERFKRVWRAAQSRGLLKRDTEAEEVWASIYPVLEAETPGLAGAILSRGAANVLRLSLLYALLDEGEADRPDPAIRARHVLAALAIWEFSKASVLRIFGAAIGDPIADRLLWLIQGAPQTDTALYESLGRHAYRKAEILNRLVRMGLVHPWLDRSTGGRPRRWWHAGASATCPLCTKEAAHAAA